MRMEMSLPSGFWKGRIPEYVAELNEATRLLREEYPDIQASVQDGCADIREMVGEITDYIKLFDRNIADLSKALR